MDELPVSRLEERGTAGGTALSRKVAWHSIEIPQLEIRLSTDFREGITEKRALDLQKRYGFNTLGKVQRLSFVGKTIAQFKNPLIAVLFVALIVTVVLGHTLDSVVIGIALLINVLIGAFQEERSSKAFEKLQASQEKYTSVIREGKRRRIPIEEVVVGDIVILESGSNVPADIRLLEGSEISVNEAPLTGEWVSVVKDPAIITGEKAVAEQSNMLWAGTLIVSGTGRGVVVEVGKNTQIGEIAALLSEKDTIKTPIQKTIHSLAIFITYIVLGALVVIFLLGMVRGQTFFDILLVAIAVAVSAVPEGLPAAVTVVLAIGMEKILKKRGLVRNILTAETLGSTTTIITDKTGTLTEAKMSLEAMISLDSLNGVCDQEDLLECNEDVLRMGVLSSDAFIEEGAGEDGDIIVHGRPIEKAIVLAGLARGLSESVLESKYPRIDFLTFSSENRFAISLNKDTKGNRMYFSGAPEKILELSTRAWHGGKMEDMTPENKARFETAQKEESAKGRRVTAIAFRNTTRDTISRSKDGGIEEKESHNLVFVGLLVFGDPIRSDVPDAIARAMSAGARVIMATGDNPETARAIAYETGIITSPNAKVYRGVELDMMSDADLLHTLQTHKVFARVLPSQKLRLVHVLRNAGEVVAMTGDGINDAPALQNADIGVVVGSGTDVAKEASDLILLDNSFAIIVSAIKEGRRIIDNLKRIIVHMLSTSFGEIFLIAGTLAFALPLPILPTQILWLNLAQGGLLNFAFAFEPSEKGIMKRKPSVHSAKNVISGDLKKFIFSIGTVTGIFTFLLFTVLYAFKVPLEELRTIMFVTLSFDTIFFIFSLKEFENPLWKIRFFSNKFLLLTTLLSTLIVVASIAFVPLRSLLTLTTLTSLQIALLVGVALFNVLTIEVAKYFIFWRKPKPLISS